MANQKDEPTAKYIIGHDKGVINALSARTAARQMAFLLPHLRSDMLVLDVGCGPGSITCDIAGLVPSGHVTGVDLSPTVVAAAEKAASTRKIENVKFIAGDVQNGIPFDDGSFDLVYCHQLLNHLSDPIKALGEMKRLCKPSGIVAVREGICSLWYPESPALQDLDRVLETTMKANGAFEPGAGRRLMAWTKAAGLNPNRRDFMVSGRPATSPEGRARQRGFLQASYSEGAALRKMAVAAGVDERRIADGLEAGMKWAEDEEAFHVLVCGEIVCMMDAIE